MTSYKPKSKFSLKFQHKRNFHFEPLSNRTGLIFHSPDVLFVQTAKTFIYFIWTNREVTLIYHNHRNVTFFVVC